MSISSLASTIHNHTELLINNLLQLFTILSVLRDHRGIRLSIPLRPEEPRSVLYEGGCINIYEGHCRQPTGKTKGGHQILLFS